MKRAAAGKKFSLAAERAAEKAAKHPQLMDSTEIVPTDPKGMPQGAKDNLSGLTRVVGRGKKLKGGAAPAADAPAPEDPSVMGLALARHLRKARGGAFMKGFVSGMSSARSRSSSPEVAVVGCRGKGRPAVTGKRIEEPAGRQVSHAIARDIPPGAVPAQAYGNPPQAPASFARNTVGMGMPEPSQKAARRRLKEPMNGGNMPPVGSGAPRNGRHSRGAAISRLMKEHGMTLGQASRHLKEHTDA